MERGRHLWALAAVAVVGMVAGGCTEMVERRLYGVRPGVTLEGRPVGGLLPQELRRVVERMASVAEHDPTDAAIDRATGQILAERPGVAVDVDSTVDAVRRAEPGEAVALVRVGIRPRVEAATLRRLDRLLGSYVTWMYGSPDRIHNIRLAAAAIHNTVLLPGEVFSFNDVVGRRTPDRGYRPAPVIVGESVGEGVGGGICQVSTTLYNAARRAGLTVLERHLHGLSPPYVPPGQDATVNWPDLDLKLRNDRDTPVLIAAEAGGDAIVVRILGRREKE